MQSFVHLTWRCRGLLLYGHASGCADTSVHTVSESRANQLWHAAAVLRLLQVPDLQPPAGVAHKTFLNMPYIGKATKLGPKPVQKQSSAGDMFLRKVCMCQISGQTPFKACSTITGHSVDPPQHARLFAFSAQTITMFMNRDWRLPGPKFMRHSVKAFLVEPG